MIGTEGVIGLVRDLHEERLALTALIAVAAGDDLDGAVERIESVVDAMPEPGELSRKGASIVTRTARMAESTLSDLRQLRDHERAQA